MLLSIFSVWFVHCAGAQLKQTSPLVDFVETIVSPVSGEIINGNSVDLNVSVTNTGFILTEVLSINYNVYVDGVLFRNESQILNTRQAGFSAYTNWTLTNLIQGKHIIKVDAKVLTVTFSPILRTIYPSSITSEKTAEITLLVYQGIPPQVSILGSDFCETNQTTFNITTNEPDAHVSYSLDGGANVTLPQNESTPLQNSYIYIVTLGDLSLGSHTLTAYVQDVFNQSAAAEKSFTVVPLSISTIAVAAGATTAIVLGVAAMLIFKKRKRQTQYQR